MTSFYNFALEIETSPAKKYVKASLENWNPVMLLCIHSRIKKVWKHVM